MKQAMEERTDFDVIVVGGGPAGVAAALRASELGVNVALVERRRMGGTCTNDGCVPTRVLAHTARLIRESRQFAEYGLAAPAPELDFEQVMRRVSRVVYSIHEKKQLIENLNYAGVTVFSEVGEAQFADPHTLALADGRRLHGEKFIVCAGGRSRRIDFPGAELALTHSDVWMLRKLPESLIIVGGAATGCQLASIFADFGTRVAVLERAGHLLAREDAAVSALMSDSFRQRGIQVITGIGTVEKIEARGNVKELTYTVDGQAHTLQAEGIILSAGWVGNVSSLNLEAAGVQSDGRYIQVNDYLQSNVPHIFAAGDITGRMMLVQSAGMEAQSAAVNAVIGVGQPERHQIVPHGGFTDPEYASVGLTEDQARLQGECEVAIVYCADLDRAVIDGRTTGLCKLIVSVEDHRILGVHVGGEQAMEIVHMAAAGMASRMWVEQLAELQIAYPTYTAIIGLAARKISRQLGVVPLAREWQSLEKAPVSEWEARV
jgi:dihydrolipoamide dehydrogenase